MGLSKRKLTSALQRLEDAGATETLSTGEVVAVEEVDPEEAAQMAAAEHETRRQGKRERLEAVRTYADSAGCRREMLLRYFGDEFQGPCNFCDNCEAATGKITVDPSVGTRREVV